MKKILNKLVEYKYKFISLFSLTIISIMVGTLLNVGLFSGLLGGLFAMCILYILVGFGYGVYNLWEDSKVEAIIFSVVGVIFISLLVFVLANSVLI